MQVIRSCFHQILPKVPIFSACGANWGAAPPTPPSQYPFPREHASARLLEWPTRVCVQDSGARLRRAPCPLKAKIESSEAIVRQPWRTARRRTDARARAIHAGIALSLPHESSPTSFLDATRQEKSLVESLFIKILASLNSNNGFEFHFAFYSSCVISRFPEAQNCYSKFTIGEAGKS